VVLQTSSYWQAKNAQPLQIKLLPELELHPWLLRQQQEHSKVLLKNIISKKFPKRLVECFCQNHDIVQRIHRYDTEQLSSIADLFQHWLFWPEGTQGYRLAEVTIGGVDTDAISSKTMQAKQVPHLYFIGEVLDVAGHLGGYNFQWAWSSGFTAGQFV